MKMRQPQKRKRPLKENNFSTKENMMNLLSRIEWCGKEKKKEKPRVIKNLFNVLHVTKQKRFKVDKKKVKILLN